jgi:hypothetical protein
MTQRNKAARKLLEDIPYCEYCRLPGEIVPHGLWIDHIIPRAKGGGNEYDNLCVSCVSCNQAKATAVGARDPQTNLEVPLFHPRQDFWSQHFRYSKNKTRIEGLTAKGRATIIALQMNKSQMVQLRRLLIKLDMLF